MIINSFNILELHYDNDHCIITFLEQNITIHSIISFNFILPLFNLINKNIIPIKQFYSRKLF